MSNTPDIRFKEFTEPWEQRRFSDLVVIERGGSPRPIDKFITKNENGLNWVKIGDAPDQGNYITKTVEKIIPEGLSKTREVHPGDLILSNSMSFGKPYIMAIDGCIHDGWLLIRDTKKVFDLMFLCILLGTDNMLNQYKAMAAGSTVNNLNKELVGGTTVAFPKLDEQQKIGEYFKILDNLITLHQRKCDGMSEFKNFMLQKMFPKNGEQFPEIRFNGFTDPWEQRKLEKVAKYRNGKAHENEIDIDGEYIVVNSKFVSTDGEVRKFSNSQNEPLYENELAFVLSDVPNGRAIARTFLVDKSNKYTLNQRIAGITPLEGIDPYYLHIRMNRNPYFLKFDDGNKQTNLSIKDVLNYEDMYPKYEEQKKIGTYFRDIDNLITLHQRKRDELKDLKKFMLQNMFPKKG